MKVCYKRFWENLCAVGNIGADEAGGITRPAYTPAYQEARAALLERLSAAGLEVRVDAVGNVFARRAGTDPDKPAIMVGSHLDTVNNGGLYDGCLGVIAALECLETMNDNGIKTTHPVELAAFTAEEGGPLGGTFGSRAMTGRQFPDTAEFGSALQSAGISRQDVGAAKRDMSEVACFVELHIEQGGILEHERKQIGIVEGVVGITRYEITAVGEANHAGTTPMALRRDALTAMAKLLLEIERTAAQMGPPFVATVGTLEILPGHVSIVPGQVRVVLEMRDLDQQRIQSAAQAIFACADKIDGATFTHSLLVDKPPVATNAHINQQMEALCREQGLAYMRMPSGAGHDAKEIAFAIPTSMVFIPSAGGVSHSPKEYTAPDDLATGVQFLLDTIMTLDANMPQISEENNAHSHNKPQQ